LKIILFKTRVRPFPYNEDAPRSAKLSNDKKKKMEADSPSSRHGTAHAAADLPYLSRPAERRAELPGSAAHSVEGCPPSSSIAWDILYGAEQIAQFLYGNPKYRRKVYNIIGREGLPNFRLGAIICSRKSVLLDWITRQEKGETKD
jgi:hypothetical protein